MGWLKKNRDLKGARRLANRSNEEWLAALRASDPGAALEDLRLVLVQALLPVLRQRVPSQAEDMAQDIAQEATLHILDRLESFRGEAKFTTWSAKVAVRLAISELRRQRWKDFSLDEMLDKGGTPQGSHNSPADEAVSSETVAWVHKLIAEELTERQRAALEAVMIHGVTIEIVAERMGTNRNALYKLLHDARLRLRRAFEAHGLSLDDFLTDD